MPTVKVPLFNEVIRNVDGVELSDKNFLLMNGYVNEMGAEVRRPGLEYVMDRDAANAVLGLYYWPQQDKIVCVYDDYYIQVASGNFGRMHYWGGFSDLQRKGRPVSFATDGSNVFMAWGDTLYAVRSSGVLVRVADSDTDVPSASSHVAYLDGYILANVLGTNKFMFSDPNNGFSWNALNFASAAGDSDNIDALHVLNREVFLFGLTSVEIWENDGTTPFSRKPGGFLQIGCVAPYSICVSEDTLYWLSNQRQFVSYKNGTLERISTPYDNELTAEKMPVVDDCIGYRIDLAGRPNLVWTFPTAGRTLVYDYKLGKWNEWSYWNLASAKDEAWLGRSYCFNPKNGQHYVGGRKFAEVLHMSQNVFYDSNPSQPIRFCRRTGHIDYGTSKNKRSDYLRLRLKRGVDLQQLRSQLPADWTNRTPKLMLRWNDNEEGWSNEHWIDLGDTGKKTLIKQLSRTGTYRTRQYELVMTDPVPLVIGDVEEDITVLRY